MKGWRVKVGTESPEKPFPLCGLQKDKGITQEFLRRLSISDLGCISWKPGNFKSQMHLLAVLGPWLL